MTTIRRLEARDKAEFIFMANQFYSGPGVLHKVDPRVIERTYDEMISDSPFLEGYIFEDNGSILGYAELSFSFAPEVGGRSVFIEEIFVKEEHRGKGIGHLFLDYCLSLVKGETRRIRLEATKTNKKAIALYESYGFEVLDYLQMVVDRP